MYTYCSKFRECLAKKGILKYPGKITISLLEPIKPGLNREEFIKNLEDLKTSIENEDGKKIEKIFIKTKKIRKEIVEAGQDVEKPDFGRK